MAAAQERFLDHFDGIEGGGGGEGEPVPPAFRAAVDALRAARVRPEVELAPTRPPRRLAPWAYALEAVAAEDGGDLADGRLVLLHDPAGHEAWRGTFRLVTLVRAELEPEMAADPLLPEVCWSWLTGALEARALSYAEASGTVTRAGSYYFGGLADRRPATQIEIRASWTPGEGRGGAPDAGAHLAAWGDLLCQVAGLPPSGPESREGGGAGVVPLPQRRGPRRT
ncbi:DUF3000 domain-containing protein [Streptomyces somaliensis]|uniref:DUF3000 domain-containing protein n=1 Tax=Streptomyces somaliensis (strain ATCC 33201 / DSM 40738 / JCM 12659 / KCTC 9044 / NCTC 11332 / NRRL B-12077 / IP 733) TaxID=1134445 RepID=A0AA44IDE4_STRE0|nr:DUF3000 domain-containing protein [Streptomyces somaliensis]NKY14422.1 DUF3000 domain-containing protein [Streptomyces somaliensis DSM 40738]